LDLTLKISIPTVVALIVIPFLLYKCVRVIRDVVSESGDGKGMILNYDSDGGSSDTSERERAMWVGDDDTRREDAPENNLFVDPGVRNVPQVFRPVAHSWSDSSSF
jgi:hypothetical protein